MLTTKHFKHMLGFYFEPIKYMKMRYPKAARKKRMIKKWQSRYGIDTDWVKAFNAPNPFLSRIEKDNPWQGASIPIPLSYE